MTKNYSKFYLTQKNFSKIFLKTKFQRSKKFLTSISTPIFNPEIFFTVNYAKIEKIHNKKNSIYPRREILTGNYGKIRISHDKN